MTKRQKLQIEQSELRQKINALLGLDELTDEQRAEMEAHTKRAQELEPELRAAIVSEGAEEAEARGQFGNTGDGEQRARLELRSRCRVANYFTAALEMRAVNGVEAEFNQEEKIGLDRFPLELLAPVEERATTATDSVENQQSWLDRLFAQTAAARLGVTMRSVAPGVASFPITTAGATGAQRAKEEAAAAAAWTVGVTELKPTRDAVHATFVMEDAARLPGLEDALTRDLGAALTDAIDKAIFVGDAGATGTDADITGLQTAADIVEKTIGSIRDCMH